jgi:hypothetical protein
LLAFLQNEWGRSVSGTAMSEMEKVLTQFGGVFDGAAGPVRAVASRTCDLLPAVTRVASVLHPELDLLDRSVKLLTRLEVGVPAGAVEIARHAGSRLTRGDYQQLIKAGLATAAAVEIAADEHLHACLGGDGEKVAAIRAAAREYHEWDLSVLSPILPEYEA